ncbi:MAG TPA: class I adenylate-forming enzyme family protein [Acidimicrobiales bacterium]|nr:class I adenylate-forming enzyme family protein [Acidimicrobiales bacterium]
MLPAVINEAARRFGDTPALVAPDGAVVTFADLDRRSDAVAVALAGCGVGLGDVVALTLPTVPEYVVTYLAAAKVGAITAGVNPRLADAERARMLEIAEPAVVATTVEDVVELEKDGADGTPPTLPDDEQRSVAIVFTSGTTGMPKGAVFTNRQLQAIVDIDTGGTWGGGSKSVASTSLAHVGFMTKLPWYLMSGGARYLLDRWDADTNLRLVAEHRMTNVGGVPTQVALMLRAPTFADYDLACVQSVVLGGGPAPVPLQREAAARFNAPVSIRFSSTETGGCGTGTALDDPIGDEYGVGLPRGPITVAVRDEDGRALPVGEVGEICVRSPSVMAGYYRDADATAAAFTEDGAVRTGDLGWLDDHGRLHLAGRSKEMYVRGGYNVYPAEVEAVLLDHPSVAAVAVVATLDDVMGEKGTAVVVVRDGAAAPALQELRDFAVARVASYKLPDAVKVIDDLPLTAMDKIDRRALERLLAKEQRRPT